MGNKASGDPPQKEEFKEYSHFAEQNTKLFGKVFFYRKKGESKGTLVRIMSKKDSQTVLAEPLKRHTEIVKTANDCLLEYKGNTQDMPLMKKQKIKEPTFMNFGSFDFDLDFEITKRQLKKRHFTEAEMWSLLYVTINGLAAMQEAGTHHGCICRKTILVASLDFKMIDPHLMGVMKESVFPYNDLTFFSEELREGVTPTDPQILEQKIKCDVFFLGLALIQACTLEELPDKSNVSVGDLNALLLTLKVEYPDDIYRIIREMLIIKLQVRPDALTLRKILNLRLTASMPLDRVSNKK